MGASKLFIFLAIIVLAIIAAGIFFGPTGSRGKKLSPLAGLAFICVITGLILVSGRLLGYLLLIAGILVAVADIIMKRRKEEE